MSDITTQLSPGEVASLTGVVVTSGTQADARQSNLDATDVIRHMAATRVRRMCNQHRCSGPGCEHPNHRRDVDYLGHVLDVLGLPGAYQEVTQEDRDRLLTSLAQQPEEHLETSVKDED